MDFTQRPKVCKIAYEAIGHLDYCKITERIANQNLPSNNDYTELKAKRNINHQHQRMAARKPVS